MSAIELVDKDYIRSMVEDYWRTFLELAVAQQPEKGAIHTERFEDQIQSSAELMPETMCHAVEPVAKTDSVYGPHRVHDLTNSSFINASGFGLVRMLYTSNDRGKYVASKEIKVTLGGCGG